MSVRTMGGGAGGKYFQGLPAVLGGYHLIADIHKGDPRTFRIPSSSSTSRIFSSISYSYLEPMSRIAVSSSC
jgi:hypothetical protein